MRKRSRRRLWHVSAEGFQELRLSLGLSQQAAAKALGVCLRTVRHWDRGRNRVPWAAVRLLRLLRGGDLGELSPRWAGWRVLGDRLVTPAGVTFGAHEFTWWALTCLQARSWQRAFDRSASRPSAGVGLPAAVPVVDGDALELCPVGSNGETASSAPDALTTDLLTPLVQQGQATAARGARQRAAGTGLVSNATKGTRDRESEAGCGLSGVDVGPQWGQNGATNPTVNGHDGTPKAQPETPARAARGPARSGGARVHQRQRGDGGGAAQLDPVAQQAAAARRPSGHDLDGSAHASCQQAGDRAQGRAECALPVRQRPEVQALPRQGLKVPSPASLAASGDGGCGEHNRGQCPQKA